LAKYGRREVAAASIAGGSATVLLAILSRSWSGWLWVAAIVMCLWAWVIWFFRDPERQPPEGEGLIVSPADGRVTDVTRLGPDSVLGCDGVQIGVFMSIFDVHVNRSPCSGTVESIEHKPGLFLDARNPAASQRNEAATIRIRHRRRDRDLPVVVRQIAGFVARRIVTDLTPGEEIGPAHRIGMVKFGSRLEVLMPDELAGEVTVTVGQKVRAGQTVLARTAPPERP